MQYCKNRRFSEVANIEQTSNKDNENTEKTLLAMHTDVYNTLRQAKIDSYSYAYAFDKQIDNIYNALLNDKTNLNDYA